MGSTAEEYVDDLAEKEVAQSDPQYMEQVMIGFQNYFKDKFRTDSVDSNVSFGLKNTK